MYYDDEDEQQGIDSEGIKNLRKQYREAQKRLKDMESELDALRSSERSRSVADVVASKGFNQKVVELIPDYLTDRAEIERWLDDRADLFGGRVSNEPGDVSPPVAAPVNADRMASALEVGEPIAGDESTLLAQIAAAKTPQELNRLLFGNEAGPAI